MVWCVGRCVVPGSATQGVDCSAETRKRVSPSTQERRARHRKQCVRALTLHHTQTNAGTASCCWWGALMCTHTHAHRHVLKVTLNPHERMRGWGGPHTHVPFRWARMSSLAHTRAARAMRSKVAAPSNQLRYADGHKSHTHIHTSDTNITTNSEQRTGTDRRVLQVHSSNIPHSKAATRSCASAECRWYVSLRLLRKNLCVQISR